MNIVTALSSLLGEVEYFGNVIEGKSTPKAKKALYSICLICLHIIIEPKKNIHNCFDGFSLQLGMHKFVLFGLAKVNLISFCTSLKCNFFLHVINTEKVKIEDVFLPTG